MFSKTVLVSLLAGLAAAYHTPVGNPSGNAITSPLNEAIPAGKPFTIKWQADSPNKVSLILLKGGSFNAVFDQVIVESIDNTGSFTWTPPTSLEGSEGAGGYGIQLIDDVDGHYQYSTQFGISNDAPVESSSAPASSAPAPSSAPASSAPAPSAPAVSNTPEGYAVSSSAAYEAPSSAPAPESTDCTTTTTVYATIPAVPVGTGGAGAPPAPIYPTGAVPSSLQVKPTGTGGYVIPTPGLPEFEGAASNVKAGLGLVGAVAALVFML